MNTRMTRRSLIGTGAAIVVGAVVAGALGYYAAGGFKPSPVTTSSTTAKLGPTPGTVNVFTVAGPRWDQPMEALIPGFKTAYPGVDVSITTADIVTEIFAKGPLLVGQNTYSYDLFSILRENVLPAANNGHLLPLDDYVNDPNFGIPDLQNFKQAYANPYAAPTTDYPTAQVAGYTFLGPDGNVHLYGIPTDGNTEIAVWRTDLAAAAGYPDGPPDDLDHMLEFVKAVHKPPNVYGWAVGMLVPRYSYLTFQDLLWEYGGDVLTYDKVNQKATILLDQGDAATTALDLLTELFKYSPPGLLEWFDPEMNQAVGVTGNVAYSPFDFGNPTPFLKSLSPFADKLASKIVPKGPKARACINFGVGVIVQAAAKNPFDAYLFGRYQQQTGDPITTYVKNTGQVARLSTLRDPTINALPGLSYFKAMADSLGVSRNYETLDLGGLPNWADLQNVIGNEVATIVQGKESSATGVKNMVAGLTTVLAQAGEIKTSTTT